MAVVLPLSDGGIKRFWSCTIILIRFQLCVRECVKDDTDDALIQSTKRCQMCYGFNRLALFVL